MSTLSFISDALKSKLYCCFTLNEDQTHVSKLKISKRSFRTKAMSHPNSDFEEIPEENKASNCIYIFSHNQTKDFGKVNTQAQMNRREGDLQEENKKVKRKYRDIKQDPIANTGIEASKLFHLTRNSQLDKKLCNTIDFNHKGSLIKRRNFKSFCNSDELYALKINIVRERLLSDLKCEYKN